MLFLLKKDSSYRDTEVTMILIQAITLNSYFIGFQRICVHVARRPIDKRIRDRKKKDNSDGRTCSGKLYIVSD